MKTPVPCRALDRAAGRAYAAASLTVAMPPMTAIPPDTAAIALGTPAFRRVRTALFLGGFATFALLYCVQPLMPLLSQTYRLSPAAASLALSAATGALSLTLIAASVLSDRYGRRPVMVSALTLAALLALLSAAAADFAHLVLLRALEGVALAGLPAVAMAYLSEEIEPEGLGYAMGLYISGSALGGMSGRVFAAWVGEAFSWRVALAAVGAIGLALAFAFWRSLPPSRRFRPRSLHPRVLAEGMRGHLADAGLPWLFATAFLLMGCFVSLYNYLGYRLGAPPFNLGPGATGMIFMLYLVGSAASTWAGRLADRLGRRRVLWWITTLMLVGLLLTLSSQLAAVVLGVALFTFGFFGSHAVASGWVGRRARQARGLASALYLFAYYAGSSVLGTASGLVWSVGGWGAVVGVLALGLLACLAIALRLRRLEPLPPAP